MKSTITRPFLGGISNFWKLRGMKALVTQLVRGGGRFLKSFRMLSQVMGSFNCGNGGVVLVMNFLLTHDIPAIKLGNSKSLPGMQFFLISPTLLMFSKC